MGWMSTVDLTPVLWHVPSLPGPDCFLKEALGLAFSGCYGNIPFSLSHLTTEPGFSSVRG